MAVLPLDEARENTVRITAAIAEHAPFDPEMAAAISATERHYRRLLEAFLADAVAAGEVRPGLNHERIVRILFALSGGLSSRLLYEPLPEDEVRAMIADTVDGLLDPPDALRQTPLRSLG